ncbi:MAG: PilT/PilU family type 4a pilus ATPase [Clostridia bacterium]|nr:PilT/PilU family type 4a pilus ATPase [Clostridia bacterium]
MEPIYKYSEKITRYLNMNEEYNASDMHLKSGITPIIRVGSMLKSLDSVPLTSEEIFEFANQFMTDKQKKTLEDFHEVDSSFFNGEQRYRCNVYRDINGYNISIRRVMLQLSSFEKLGIPECIKPLALKKSGMILFTGPTGSGKSTTLSCIVDFLNHKVNSHIITLEDPIECIHKSNTCLISQREVGRDTVSFEKGLQAAMRQDPDVIMLGEMRSIESVSTAVSAAETGHLMLSTLHTKGCENTIDRIIDMFPAGQQNQIRVQLSMVLLGVVSQQLVPRIDVPNGRVLATEVMIASGAIKNLIRTGKTHQITSTIQTSASMGMHTMDSSLQKLYEDGIISEESVKMYSFNTDASN